MLLFFLFLVASTWADCPKGTYVSTDESTCYDIHDTTSDWATAEAICNYRGGHLLSLHSPTQTKLLTKIIDTGFYNDDEFFIGANFNIYNNSWQWADGSPFDYSNILLTPNTYLDANSVLTYRKSYIQNQNGKWIVRKRTDLYGFLCGLPQCGSNNTVYLSPSVNTTGLIYMPASNSFYWGFHSETLPLDQAEAMCVSFGGHLPAIHNAFDNNEILNVIQILVGKLTGGTRVPLGLYGDLQGNFHWLDGSPYNYANWFPTEPLMVYNAYATIDVGTGKWWTDVGFIPFHFVCQLPLYNYQLCSSSAK